MILKPIKSEHLDKIINYDDEITNIFRCASVEEMRKFAEELLSRFNLYDGK